MVLRRVWTLVAGFAAVAVFSSAVSATDLAPHRAIYDMRLGAAKRGSTILDVRGAMVIETGESCDGWEVNQRMRLTYSRADAEQVESDSTYASFESKDGQNYRFTVRTIEDGTPDEQLRGIATFENSRGEGRAVFHEPENKEFALPKGTLFPTAHTAAVIDRAKAGEFGLFRPVFDGGRLEGAFDVNAIITGKEPRSGVDIKHPLLQNQPLWVVHLAFFPSAKGEDQPEYEMTVELLGNGVAQAIALDYGDFSVQGRLASIEELPRPKCK
ncbi:MAG: cell envelope integrity EipB family protein [Reyranellaceae bacterium]